MIMNLTSAKHRTCTVSQLSFSSKTLQNKLQLHPETPFRENSTNPSPSGAVGRCPNEPKEYSSIACSPLKQQFQSSQLLQKVFGAS